MPTPTRSRVSRCITRLNRSPYPETNRHSWPDTMLETALKSAHVDLTQCAGLFASRDCESSTLVSVLSAAQVKFFTDILRCSNYTDASLDHHGNFTQSAPFCSIEHGVEIGIYLETSRRVVKEIPFKTIRIAFSPNNSACHDSIIYYATSRADFAVLMLSRHSRAIQNIAGYRHVLGYVESTPK